MKIIQKSPKNKKEKNKLPPITKDFSIDSFLNLTKDNFKNIPKKFKIIPVDSQTINVEKGKKVLCLTNLLHKKTLTILFNLEDTLLFKRKNTFVRAFIYLIRHSHRPQSNDFDACIEKLRKKVKCLKDYSFLTAQEISNMCQHSINHCFEPNIKKITNLQEQINSVFIQGLSPFIQLIHNQKKTNEETTFYYNIIASLYACHYFFNTLKKRYERSAGIITFEQLNEYKSLKTKLENIPKDILLYKKLYPNNLFEEARLIAEWKSILTILQANYSIIQLYTYYNNINHKNFIIPRTGVYSL